MTHRKPPIDLRDDREEIGTPSPSHEPVSMDSRQETLLRVARKIVYPLSRRFPKFSRKSVGAGTKHFFVFLLIGAFLVGVGWITVMAQRGTEVVETFSSLGTTIERGVTAIRSNVLQGNTLQASEELRKLHSEIVDAREHLPSRYYSAYGDGTLLSKLSTLFEVEELLYDAGLVGLELVGSGFRFVADVSQLSPEELSERYTSLTSFLSFHIARVEKEVVPRVQEADRLLQKLAIDELPEELREKVRSLATLVGGLSEGGALLVKHAPVFLSLLGDQYPKNYAVLFQNSNEVRPTGGFVGSVLYIKLNDGWFERFEMEDIYLKDNQVAERLPAPQGLARITPYFGMRDSNYWPDFPTSARQFMWFYEREGYGTLDGVFALTDESLVRLLEPIDGLELAGQRLAPFLTPLLLSTVVESKVDGKEPKQILFDLLPEVILKSVRSLLDNPQDMLAWIRKEQEEKRLLAYSRHEREQQLFQEIGVDGAFPLTQVRDGYMHDFLELVYTSYSANKSDFFMSERVFHETEITSSNEVLVTLTLLRTHRYDAGWDGFIRDMVLQVTGEPASEKLMDILGAGTNRQYLRVYVPKGATLLSLEQRGSSGTFTDLDRVDISQDFGRSVFGLYSEVPAGEEERVVLTYRLPQPLYDVRGVDAQIEKQPGGRNLVITKELIVDEDRRIQGFERDGDFYSTGERTLSHTFLLQGSHRAIVDIE